MNWRRNVFTLMAMAVALPPLSLPGHATATADCNAKDANIEFDFRALATRSTGGLFDINVMGEVFAEGVPENLRKLPLGDNLRNTWVTSRQFNLLFEPPGPGNAEPAEWSLLIETTGIGDDLSFEGNYELIIPRTLKEGESENTPLTGKISCSNG
jgi:hypothetical protein